MVRRTKTKYFQGGRLLWDEHTSAGKYVRENCKTIKVIITLFCRIIDNLTIFVELPTERPGGSREPLWVDQKYADVWTNRQDQPWSSAEVISITDDEKGWVILIAFFYQTSILWQNPLHQSSQFRKIDPRPVNNIYQWIKLCDRKTLNGLPWRSNFDIIRYLSFQFKHKRQESLRSSDYLANKQGDFKKLWKEEVIKQLFNPRG